ncbi:PilZ domain-containing protein [Erythrobacteraceae bacterium CFH 75059]|uniref:PilZ domain-containing protein n=1 Tax=Qipengyuania thermophila TaxID=2509361 RepID=UPI001021EBB6|nr:PilZ domain-containing protein [Qipengyuania thermophila]TCD06585.1 PilZ domain-containing protein [Erythrobacteraceae bacterium CFH 75059]
MTDAASHPSGFAASGDPHAVAHSAHDRTEAGPAGDPRPNQRAAPRYVSLIRAAKLVTEAGEFVCVVRDVSQTGVKVKLFHPLPPRLGTRAPALELQNGERFALRLVRHGEGEASFAFNAPVAVERLIREHWTHPKRQFRLNMTLPVEVFRAAECWSARLDNISQQGARLVLDRDFAVDQLLRIEGAELGVIMAKVRWHRDGHSGLVFENTFSLAEIALLAARVQCPEIV